MGGGHDPTEIHHPAQTRSPGGRDEALGGGGLACREGIVAALHGVDEEVGDVDPVEGLVEPLAADGVAGDDGQVDADAGGVAREPPQLVAVLAQPGDEGGAGEAGHAGDEDAHPTRRYAMACEAPKPHPQHEPQSEPVSR